MNTRHLASSPEPSEPATRAHPLPRQHPRSSPPGPGRSPHPRRRQARPVTQRNPILAVREDRPQPGQTGRGCGQAVSPEARPARPKEKAAHRHAGSRDRYTNGSICGSQLRHAYWPGHCSACQGIPFRHLGCVPKMSDTTRRSSLAIGMLSRHCTGLNLRTRQGIHCAWGVISWVACHRWSCHGCRCGVCRAWCFGGA
jgi:hypothetical protein